MAALVRKLLVSSPLGLQKTTSTLAKSEPTVRQVRHRVCYNSGAMLPEPETSNFGVLKALLTVLPGLYIGATISKEGAAFLEENDIFVPDDDDDDG
ncbi:essential MCU regulator, mitochondrial-like [Amblyomma americanum]|uniref:Essential MCU regulator, mitochondrial n=1 Tax=Amblyomma americanum TaxID=6943 RepID=A0A0C9RZQ8_AMBAM